MAASSPSASAATLVPHYHLRAPGGRPNLEPVDTNIRPNGWYPGRNTGELGTGLYLTTTRQKVDEPAELHTHLVDITQMLTLRTGEQVSAASGMADALMERTLAYARSIYRGSPKAIFASWHPVGASDGEERDLIHRELQRTEKETLDATKALVQAFKGKGNESAKKLVEFLNNELKAYTKGKERTPVLEAWLHKYLTYARQGAASDAVLAKHRTMVDSGASVSDPTLALRRTPWTHMLMQLGYTGVRYDGTERHHGDDRRSGVILFNPSDPESMESVRPDPSSAPPSSSSSRAQKRASGAPPSHAPKKRARGAASSSPPAPKGGASSSSSLAPKRAHEAPFGRASKRQLTRALRRALLAARAQS